MALHDSSLHDMPMDGAPHEMCKMNMLFTWEWRNTCVIYKWWHVKTLGGMLGTLVAIAVLGMLYEYLRFRVARWRSQLVVGPSMGPVTSATRITRPMRVRSAVLYAVQVGYSFMLMLVFMTYNGWYMAAVVVGAGMGYYFWGDAADSKSMVCH